MERLRLLTRPLSLVPLPAILGVKTEVLLLILGALVRPTKVVTRRPTTPVVRIMVLCGVTELPALTLRIRWLQLARRLIW